MTLFARKVEHADRSPMNASRWLLFTACGHTQWVTSSRRPKIGKLVRCPTCAAIQALTKRRP